jgi:hypothetical protein
MRKTSRQNPIAIGLLILFAAYVLIVASPAVSFAQIAGTDVRAPQPRTDTGSAQGSSGTASTIHEDHHHPHEHPHPSGDHHHHPHPHPHPPGSHHHHPHPHPHDVPPGQ